MLQIGIVGCGTIGTGPARAVESGRAPAMVSGLNNRTRTKANAPARALSPSLPVLDLPEPVRVSTRVVEAATHESLAKIRIEDVPSRHWPSMPEPDGARKIYLSVDGPDLPTSRHRWISSAWRWRWRKRCFSRI